MSTILKCTNICKSYGNTKVISNLELQLEENTIYGLLGRNGAGKTTLLNMITGSFFPDSGEIQVAGLLLNRGDTPKEACYVREKNLFFSDAKVIEILDMASAFHPNWDGAFANEMLKLFRLDPSMKIRKLSRGMESVVGNIIGLASRASLTIYDEPVLGLDALMREKFYSALMEDYANHPRTIVISTHLIDEIAKVVEQVFILEAGSILLKDSVDHLQNRSLLLRGNSEALRAFTRGKQVIYQESYGHGMLMAVYDTLSESDKIEADKLGITMDGIPLQKLFAYLVEGGKGFE
ncbi:ATP-binding cassette domain-containing protein [Paenibacillus sp. 32352]|uniref:ATP-binding cassette domain-containing protein n=1 Tax=Paenibacillus sp. 32352 TaxID=1969111 RepID=UPI0009AC65B7|nr:ABC transporter ATP-binding protein [Paenibacillus sp. 32352]